MTEAAPLLQYDHVPPPAQTRLGLWARRAGVVLSAYPLVTLAALYATWVAARLTLGWWPRESVDDPKSIGLWVDVPYTAFGVLALGLLPTLVASGALAVLAWTGRAARTRRGLVLTIVLPSAAWCGGLALFLWDPAGVLVWYLD
ncbi:MAG TPA: hypothetical protein VF796_28055 [Humisphaera sp.]